MPVAEVKQIGQETYRQWNDLTHLHTLESYVALTALIHWLIICSVKHMAVFGRAYLLIGGLSYADVLVLTAFIHRAVKYIRAYRGIREYVDFNVAATKRCI